MLITTRTPTVRSADFDAYVSAAWPRLVRSAWLLTGTVTWYTVDRGAGGWRFDGDLAPTEGGTGTLEEMLGVLAGMRRS